MFSDLIRVTCTELLKNLRTWAQKDKSIQMASFEPREKNRDYVKNHIGKYDKKDEPFCAKSWTECCLPHVPEAFFAWMLLLLAAHTTKHVGSFLIFS